MGARSVVSEERRAVANNDELFINERIMGGCNHPDYSLEEERSWGHTYQYAVCTSCDARAHLYNSAFHESDPLLELKLLVPRHCQDMISIRRVLRHIENHGWRWSLQQRNSAFRYYVVKGVQQIEGQERDLELDAACSAIVLLAKALPHGLSG